MKKQPFYSSFVYAAQGVRTALREERNLRFHLCSAMYVYLFSFFYDFSKIEYCLITLMVSGMIALELVNSSLERTVEHPTPDRYCTAGVVKDMAAGAVLVFSIGCVVCGVLLFWRPPVLQQILHFFLNQPFALFALLLSLVCSWLFVFAYKKGG